MQPLYQDNHIIIVNKAPGEIVQGDKTGDKPLSETVKEWIKESCAKPGNVFLGVVHRLDRPVGGVVVFAKTSKALTRLNDMIRNGQMRKTYWAIVRNRPPKDADLLTHYLTSVEKNNKTYVVPEPVGTRHGASTPAGKNAPKEAKLEYKLIAQSDRYFLLEINLLTGRKHQIRAQLAAIGCPVKGDLKYGDKRSNPDGCISLLARRIQFTHPVSGEKIDVTAPVPDDTLWQALATAAENKNTQNNG